MSDIEKCCLELGSKKARNRKVASDQLLSLLDNEDVINALNEEQSKTITWQFIFSSVNNYIIEEAERNRQNEIKKNIVTSAKGTRNDLLLKILKYANKIELRISISELTYCVIQCLSTDYIKRYYYDTYLVILKDFILSSETSAGQVQSNEWIKFLNLLTKLYDEGIDNLNILQCLCLLLKLGPLHQLPVDTLRKQFDFVQTVCNKLSLTSLRTEQEVTLEIVTAFCKHNMNDYRKSCCKLGEDVFDYVYQAYSITATVQIKTIFFDFLLLQVQIHHPYGVTLEDSNFYAFSLMKWNKILMDINKIIQCEIEEYEKKIQFKGQSTFHSVLLALIVEVYKQLNKGSIDNETCFVENSPMIKRRKLETKIAEIISEIDINSNWLNVTIITELLKKYPHIITSEEFTKLLQVISTFQAETKDKDLTEAVYNCFVVLFDVHNQFESNAELPDCESLWLSIYESALRFIGWNCTNKESHIIIQKLLVKYESFDFFSNLQTYLTNGNNEITKYVLDTLNIACMRNNMCEKVNFLSNEPDSVRKYILNWIFTDKQFPIELYTENITAQVLISLFCKLWPKRNIILNENSDCLTYNNDNMEQTLEIYNLNSFKQLFPIETINNNEENFDSYLIYDNIFEEFKKQVHDFVSKFLREEDSNSSAATLIKLLIFLANILSGLLYVNIISADTLDNCELTILLKEVFQLLYVSKFEDNKKLLFSSLVQIRKLFSLRLHPMVCVKIKEYFDDRYIKSLFEYLYEHEKGNYVQEIIEILSLYCCCYEGQMCDIQLYIVDAISEMDFKCFREEDYRNILLFTSFLKRSIVGSIPNSAINNVFIMLKSICERRYFEHKVAIDVLHILKDICRHSTIIEDSSVIQQLFTFVLQFYELRSSYGPKVSKSILNCLEEIMKLDANGIESTEFKVFEKIESFLSSPYQEIRLTAIKILVTIFNLLDYDKQNVFLANVHLQFKQLPCLQNDSRQDLNDIITCNSSIILHTYAVVICVSTVWRVEALYSMLEIAFLNSINIDSLFSILDVTSKQINYKNVKELVNFHIDTLIENWYLNNNPLSEFPFQLLGCINSEEFFYQYQSFIIPLAISRYDKNLMQELVTKTNTSQADLIKKCFAEIAAMQLISHEQTNFLTNVLSDQETLISNLRGVVIKVFERIYDEDDFNEKFSLDCNQSPIYKRKSISFHEHKQILNKLANLVSGETIMIMLKNNFPVELHKIVLQLQANIYKTASNVKKQQLAFYHYTIFVDYMLEDLNDQDDLYIFFVRSILYTIMHCIKYDYKNYTYLNIMACKYLKKICSFISLPDHLNQVLLTIVNNLILISRSENELSLNCMELLNILIIENKSKFEKIIQMLDPFPIDEKYENLIEVYNNVKYKNKTVTLREEILNFVTVGKLVKNVGSRQEGLKHLKLQLASRKDEMKDIYDELNLEKCSLIGSSNSIVHELICMLVKLSCSTNNYESVEATKCLGELGPTDITTMVLEINKNYIDVDCGPLRFITGQIIALLVEYLVDSNVEVVTATTAALLNIFMYKEAKLVSESNMDYGEGVIMKQFLTPFNSTTKKLKIMKVSIDVSKLEKNLDDANLWYPNNICTHKEWLTNLMTHLLEVFTAKDFYLIHLIPLCQIKVEFSETILPLVIYLILMKNDPKTCDIITLHIRGFFERHANLISANEQKSQIVLNKPSVQCMLNVVNFVRIQNIISEVECGEFTLDYLKLAQAAQYCGSHCTSILYGELWCQNKFDRLSKCKKIEQSQSALDVICKNESVETKMVIQEVFKESYMQLGDIDAVHGCKLTDTYNIDEQVNCYKEQNQWNEVLFQYDLQNKMFSTDALYAFKECGMYGAALHYDIISESQYECAWRLSRWDLPELNNNLNNCFEKQRYIALKALEENHKINFKNAILNARNIVIASLKNTNLESSKNLYEILSNLQSLLELEDFEISLNCNHLINVFEKWGKQDKIDVNNFRYVEPIKSQRITMLKSQLNKKFELTDKLVKFGVELIRCARTEEDYNIAERTLTTLSSIPNLSDSIKNRLLFEKAQVTWFNSKELGKNLMRYLIDHCQDDSKLYSNCLHLYGNWLSETYSANPSKIISDYFLQSLRNVESSSNISDQSDTYDDIARYSDLQYQTVVSHINSSEFDRKVKTMERSRLTAENINKKSNSTLDEKRAMITHQRQSKIDEIEIENTYKDKNLYLKLAAKYYLLNLQYDDKRNIRIFRIISLWLQNKNNTDLAEMLKKGFKNISSYKFIPILPQLIPHLSNVEDDEFSKEIFHILERCAKDHPHHTLPIVMSIANANKDIQYSKSKTNTQSNEPRILGGQKLLSKLKQNKSLNMIIQEMEKLHDAIIELAYITNEKYKESFVIHDIPKNSKIRAIKNFTKILVPTLTYPVRKDCTYDNMIGIHSFLLKFTSVGGINVPKRITCIGSDGKNRLLLVKGQDDLRQDAVMQQVFTIMNELLALNKQTKNLRIRTYKIVPLSTRSGILEWVENTMPIGEYLVGKKGAHEIYNVDDIHPNKCREMLRASAKSTNEQKLKTYLKICEKFQPVFHKFFEISFPQATIWYERRRAYMHSVATSSMCGYILGIGDRHVQNILIDKTTAEVIHIDFGIAFEQGHVLPTPETVPFRLSRDIEAGMGILGIKGGFKRSCEKTMELLRKNAETIISILEVLLYDPLYTWTITPAQAYSKQNIDDSGSSLDTNSEDDTTVNAVAERVLLRLRSKLNGTENTSPMTVEGQVERLLQEARDPANLSKLFYGWQAYL